MNRLDDFWTTLRRDYNRRTAVRSASESLTYGELDARADAVSEVLRRLDLTGGTRIAMILENDPAFLSAFLACQKTGAVPCPLNPQSRPAELHQLLNTLAPDAVIVPESMEIQGTPFAGRFPIIMAGRGCEIVRVAADPPHPDPDLHDVASIFCTSGTTGRPKATMLTHQSVLACLEAFRNLLPRWPGQHWLEDERFGNVIPLSHVYGLVMMTLMPLSLGGAVVLLPRFSPSSALKGIEEFGVTFFGGVPSMYAMLNQYQHPGRYDWSSCRYWICGGSPLPASVSEQFRSRFGATIREGFGMLETSSLATLNFDEAPRHPGSVGPFAGGLTARIRDRQGRDLPAGEAGDLWLRGPTVMKGYYRDAAGTADALRDGWLATGDIGSLDEDGYLYLRGRSKDMMIVGGHNVYPREIEQVLLSADDVADAAVAAHEDLVRGERIVAFVVASAGHVIEERTLLEHCRRHLSGFKCPRQILVIDEIPRNATGKVLRHALQERLDGSGSPRLTR